MDNGHSHIIKTQSISIDFENPETAVGLQHRMAELFYEKIQPEMEIIFEEIAGRDHIATIEKLEIECGTIPKKNWEEEWVRIVLQKLKEQLQSVDKKKIQAVDLTEKFFFFLVNGLLPWNSQIRSITAFEEKIIFDERFIELFRKNISSDKVISRLLNQFSPEFIDRMIRALLKEKEWADIVQSTGDLSLPSSDSLEQNLILKALSNIVRSVRDPGNRNTADTKKVSGEQIESDIKIGDAIFIQNAGIIILHPFLTTLFANLGLTEDNKWVSKQSQHRAVSILDFLGNGRDDSPEFTLALNKILCGLRVEDILIVGEALDRSTLAACDELLTELIGHWAVLKNTGIAALRETFLQRNGKLTKADRGGLLQVEQKGVDVLLNSLPWGIGVIKLPWMEDILYTEWNG